MFYNNFNSFQLGYFNNDNQDLDEDLDEDLNEVD
jgi:hypothetical protein